MQIEKENQKDLINFDLSFFQILSFMFLAITALTLNSLRNYFMLNNPNRIDDDSDDDDDETGI